MLPANMAAVMETISGWLNFIFTKQRRNKAVMNQEAVTPTLLQHEAFSAF